MRILSFFPGMIVALSNPYPAVVGLCLLVAVYMFAALKFPALRFMFQMKRGAAGLAGMRREDNQRLGELLGLVFCPIIGAGALLAAAWFGFQWKQDSASKKRRAELAVETRERRVRDVGTVLREWKLEDVYFATSMRMGVSAEGRSEVGAFLDQLAGAFGMEHVELNAWTTRTGRDGLTAVFRPEERPGAEGGSHGEENAQGETQGHAIVTMDLEQDVLSVRMNPRGPRLPAQGFKLLLPDEVRPAWEDLKSLERIDLMELKREEQRREAEESARLANYKEKTFAGPSAWQIFEQVNALPEDAREDKKQEFIGSRIDWEVQLGLIEEEDGKLTVRADQSPPNPGRYWSIYFEADRAQLPDVERLPRHKFARIKGTVESLEKGIRVRLDSLERFEP